MLVRTAQCPLPPVATARVAGREVHLLALDDSYIAYGALRFAREPAVSGDVRVRVAVP